LDFSRTLGFTKIIVWITISLQIVGMDQHLFDDDEEDAERSAKDKCRPRENGVLAFHEGTEDALLIYVKQQQQQHPATTAQVLSTIDAFCLER
jgi:hypothetical protein